MMKFRRWSILFVAWVAVAAMALIVFYVAWRLYENHEGAQEWQRALSDLKQRGEPSDAADLVPPRVPDAINLGALPLFQLSHVAGEKMTEPTALQTALENITHSESDFPSFGWMQGKQPDQAAIRSYLLSSWQRAFKGKTPPETSLEQFDALCPALGQLRTEAETRSVCRLEQDYTTQPIFNRPLGLTVDMIKLAKVANFHAVLALEAGQPDLALQDIELMLKIDAGLGKEPRLISGLVAIAVLVIEMQAVGEGLETHAWNDAQLAKLQQDFATINFLSDYQLCMRGEGLGSFASTMLYLKDHQQTATQILYTGLFHEGLPSIGIRLLWNLTPPGSLDQAAARGLTFYTRAAREGVDVSSHRLYPPACISLKQEAEGLFKFSLPNLLLRVTAGPVIDSASALGVGQFNADAADIACMIERYRLAHGALPTTLDQLTPYIQNGTTLPHDLCNGEPLRYGLRARPAFLTPLIQPTAKRATGSGRNRDTPVFNAIAFVSIAVPK